VSAIMKIFSFERAAGRKIDMLPEVKIICTDMFYFLILLIFALLVHQMYFPDCNIPVLNTHIVLLVLFCIKL
jgi:hypothetical protein